MGPLGTAFLDPGVHLVPPLGVFVWHVAHRVPLERAEDTSGFSPARRLLSGRGEQLLPRGGGQQVERDRFQLLGDGDRFEPIQDRRRGRSELGPALVADHLDLTLDFAPDLPLGVADLAAPGLEFLIPLRVFHG